VSLEQALKEAHTESAARLDKAEAQGDARDKAAAEVCVCACVCVPVCGCAGVCASICLKFVSLHCVDCERARPRNANQVVLPAIV